ncbi:MAG: sulfatase [Hyphomonadaceae bacterium]|nr:sulfatase [Hyphomonadaceae bacterium]
MWKKLIPGLLLVLIALGVLAWFNRAAILTQLVLNRAAANKIDVAPFQPVAWQAGPETAQIPIEDRPPNIVFILLDDFGYNDLTTFGGGVADGRVPTPNIDRLAAQGANFTQAYSGTGTCAPSRAMLMTGRYPTRTGFEFTPMPAGMGRIVSTVANGMNRGALPDIVYNSAASEVAVPYQSQGLPGSEVTIAEVLQDHDYHTVHIGKWHLGRGDQFSANAQGFEESLLMHSGLYLNEDDPNVVNAKLDFDPIDKFLWASMQYAASFNGGAPFEPGGYLTDWWTDESLNVIEANKNRPFFLYLAHWAPHTPLQATQEDFDAVGDIQPHRLRVYAAMIRALDRSVGRVMDKLEQEGLAENTIVVLSSDNGGAGYIGLPQVNDPFRGFKITLFEGGIRVPMLVKWPAQIAPGTVIDTPVAHIDLMPTLVAAAGAALPSDLIIDGHDMLPLATGTGTIERPNDAIFWQSGFYRVVRAGGWKLQLNEQQDKAWLFDLVNDPTEQDNLAEIRPDKLAELKALIETHQASAVSPLYPHTIESPIPIDKTVVQGIEPEDEYVVWPN